MSDSNIEWTDATWNPVVGCSPVSPGCLNCYAATMSRRLEAMGQVHYKGLALRKFAHVNGYTGGRDVFNGTVRTLDDRLEEPLRWRKPRRVFVCSMSDLFHESVPFEFIDRVFFIMALCREHTFQVLTKRPDRMEEYFARPWPDVDSALPEIMLSRYYPTTGPPWDGSCSIWPIPNVWIGTSVEDQQRANERIPHLIRCPAAIRFLSCEPLLGPIDLTKVKFPNSPAENVLDCRVSEIAKRAGIDRLNGIDWVIVGGESGHGERPCDVGWIRRIDTHARMNGVPVFVKQLGAHVVCRNDQVGEWLDTCDIALDDVDTSNVTMQGDPVRVHLRDRKGGDMSEWPEDLRVREWPQSAVQA